MTCIVTTKQVVELLAAGGKKGWGYLVKNNNSSKELCTHMCTYLKYFKMWKIEDDKVLWPRLQCVLQQLEAEQAKITPEEDPEGTILEGIKKKKEEVRKRMEDCWMVPKNTHDKGHACGVGAVGGRNLMLGAGACAATVSKKQFLMEPTSLNPVGGSSSGSSSSSSGRNNVGGMTNEELAHELLLDPNFKLDKQIKEKEWLGPTSGGNYIQTRIRGVFEKSFYTALQQELCNEPFPKYEKVFSLLESIVSQVQELCKGYPEAQWVVEIVDMKLVRQNIENRLVNMESFMCMMEHVMSKIIGPTFLRMKDDDLKESTWEGWLNITKKTSSCKSKEHMATLVSEVSDLNDWNN